MSKTRSSFRYVVVIFLICFAALLTAGCRKESGEELTLKEVSAEEAGDDIKEQAEKDDAQDTESETDGPEELYVHVCGHVEQSGVYELPSGSRVYEAIEAAGGMTDTAAFSYLNQAELLEDGQKIYVPSQEEVDSGTFSQNVSKEQEGTISGTDDGKVNLNTATKEELMTLNGIGDVRAQAILQYREEHGEFRSVTELMEVEGIKKGTFEKLKDQITI